MRFFQCKTSQPNIDNQSIPDQFMFIYDESQRCCTKSSCKKFVYILSKYDGANTFDLSHHQGRDLRCREDIISNNIFKHAN